MNSAHTFKINMYLCICTAVTTANLKAILLISNIRERPHTKYNIILLGNSLNTFNSVKNNFNPE